MRARVAHALRTASGLPPQRWALAAAALPLLVGAKAALSVLPYARVRHAFDAASSVPPSRPQRPDLGRDVLWAVPAVARRLFGDRPCLPQALVGRLMLAWCGFSTTLELGAVRRRDTGEIAAHAWLEHEGGVVMGGYDSPSSFKPFGPATRGPLVEGGPAGSS